VNRQPAVLYVEDDFASRKVMQILLKGRMKLEHVNIFENSQDFSARVQALEPHPDVVFVDIHMEPHSGFEMLSMLRELEPLKDVPVVALTASVMNDEVEVLRNSGFDGCLAKPLNLEDFPNNLDRILSGEHIWQIS
jgi:CheY-like chemotaxis protein